MGVAVGVGVAGNSEVGVTVGVGVAVLGAPWVGVGEGVGVGVSGSGMVGDGSWAEAGAAGQTDSTPSRRAEHRHTERRMAFMVASLPAGRGISIVDMNTKEGAPQANTRVPAS